MAGSASGAASANTESSASTGASALRVSVMSAVMVKAEVSSVAPSCVRASWRRIHSPEASGSSSSAAFAVRSISVSCASLWETGVS